MEKFGQQHISALTLAVKAGENIAITSLGSEEDRQHIYNLCLKIIGELAMESNVSYAAWDSTFGNGLKDAINDRLTMADREQERIEKFYKDPKNCTQGDYSEVFVELYPKMRQRMKYPVLLTDAGNLNYITENFPSFSGLHIHLTSKKEDGGSLSSTYVEKMEVVKRATVKTVIANKA